MPNTAQQIRESLGKAAEHARTLRQQSQYVQGVRRGMDDAAPAPGESGPQSGDGLSGQTEGSDNPRG